MSRPLEDLRVGVSLVVFVLLFLRERSERLVRRRRTERLQCDARARRQRQRQRPRRRLVHLHWNWNWSNWHIGCNQSALNILRLRVARALFMAGRRTRAGNRHVDRVL